MIANLYAAKPNIKPATIDGFIAKQMVSNDRGPTDYDSFYGAGVVDLFKGLKNVKRSKRDAVTYVRPPSGVVLGLKSSATFSIEKEGSGQASIELPFSDAPSLQFSRVNVDDQDLELTEFVSTVVYWDDRHKIKCTCPTDMAARNALFQKGVVTLKGPRTLRTDDLNEQMKTRGAERDIRAHRSCL